jgi:Domain of unknown function (DUF4276)
VTRRIAIIVEGATESAFKKSLDNFLASRLAVRRKPRLRFISEDGRIPIGDRLRRDVVRLLETDHDDVVALTDVYTGSKPPEFVNAADAIAKMRQWVGPEPRFHPHAAQHEFEAWLFPCWTQIQNLSGSNRQCPSQTPELVDHDKPPAAYLNEVFRTGKNKRSYSKIRDGMAILRGQDLAVSAVACPELRSFLNTILSLSGGKKL